MINTRRSLSLICTFLIILWAIGLMVPQKTYGLVSCGGYTFEAAQSKLEFDAPVPSVFDLAPPTGNTKYILEIDLGSRVAGFRITDNVHLVIDKTNHEVTINGQPPTWYTADQTDALIQQLSVPGSYTLRVFQFFPDQQLCNSPFDITSDQTTACTNLQLSPPANGSYYEVGESFTYSGQITFVYNTKLISKLMDAAGQRRQDQCSGLKTDEFGNFNGSLTIGSGVPGTWTLLFGKDLFFVCDFDGDPFCSVNIQVGTAAPGPNPDRSGIKEICTFIKDGTQQKRCLDCAAGALTGGKPGVLTPFGCIEADLQGFIQKLLKIAISVAGGIAFIMIIYGGFVTMTSSGNPERLTTGKEIITSAIAGLLLIIFSVVILKIIGVDILVLPGLSP